MHPENRWLNARLQSLQMPLVLLSEDLVTADNSSKFYITAVKNKFLKQKHNFSVFALFN